MRKPRPLPHGGTIGIISPSSPSDPESLNAGIAVLKDRGFQVRLAPHVWDRHGHMAGVDADRASDFVSFYTDPAIDVIFCARGGSAACRLWPYLDWDALAALPPKMLVGYSDITSLHGPLNQRVGVASLHGPVVFELGVKTPPALVDWMFKLLQDVEPAGAVPGMALETLIGGTAEGRLCGGCLSLLTATVGTPYQLDATDSLLLIEDTDEKPWAIERDLVQLRESGILAQAAGFIIGEATNADDSKTLPMRQIWSDILSPYGKPTVLGFPAGHVLENYALPFGCRARLDADRRSLTLLEAAVG